MDGVGGVARPRIPWADPTVAAGPTPADARGRRRPVGAAALAAAVWQLAAYVQHPRADHPTISSLTNATLDAQVPRTAAFVAWLLAIVALVRR